MRRIDFEAKTDRELLILVAQQGNETVDHLTKLNSTIQKHEKRLVALETMQGCSGTKSRLRVNWQIMTWIGCVVALIIVELGKMMGWW